MSLRKEAVRNGEAESYSERLRDAGRATRACLEKVVQREPADVLLLSGGVDSSILAALDPTPAITMQVGKMGTDIHHAQQTAEYLGLN